MPADLAALVARLTTDVAAGDISSLEMVEAIVERARADQTKRIVEWLRGDPFYDTVAQQIEHEFGGPDSWPPLPTRAGDSAVCACAPGTCTGFVGPQECRRDAAREARDQGGPDAVK